MLHFPKNHPLRPLYRLLALLAGAYCLAFGVAGAVRTTAEPAFGPGDGTALGLRTNLAFSVLSILVGGLVLGVLAVGRNVDRTTLLVLGPGFILVGLAMLALLRTDANALNFSLATCIVSFLIGVVLFAAGMYIETAPRQEAVTEEVYRHSTVPRTNAVSEDPRQTMTDSG